MAEQYPSVYTGSGWKTVCPGFELLVSSPSAVVGTHESEELTNSDVLTLDRPTGASKIQLQVLDGNLRYTLDGQTDPTPSFGFRLVNEADMLIDVREDSELRVIGEAGGESLQYQWFM